MGRRGRRPVARAIVPRFGLTVYGPLGLLATAVTRPYEAFASSD
jgi:hypothetical protein